MHYKTYLPRRLDATEAFCIILAKSEMEAAQQAPDGGADNASCGDVRSGYDGGDR